MMKQNNIVLQLTRNFIPLLGVIFFNWSIFALLYSYWLETLGITFFNSIMILTAQNSPEKPPHIKKALFYLMFHAGILMFYMFFIITFIGLMVAEKQEGSGFVNYLVFIDRSFRFTILGLFIVQLMSLINNYFLSGLYKTFKPDGYYMLFNVRSVVIHLVIILGFFAFNYISKMNNTRYGIIAFALVFVLIKSIADFVIMKFGKAELNDDLDISQI
jgi:hypothetical protein